MLSYVMWCLLICKYYFLKGGRPFQWLVRLVGERKNMETILKFVLTFVDGTTEVQELPVPAEHAEAVAMQAIVQYASVGLLKKLDKENKFVLIAASQIATVEVELPKVTLATSLDAQIAGNAADNIRKITLG